MKSLIRCQFTEKRKYGYVKSLVNQLISNSRYRHQNKSRSCLWCKFKYRKSGYCKNHPAKLQSVFVSSTRSRKQTNDQFLIMPCFLLGGSVYSHFRPWLTIFFCWDYFTLIYICIFYSFLYHHCTFFFLKAGCPSHRQPTPEGVDDSVFHFLDVPCH